jgi:hypothetical protein
MKTLVIHPFDATMKKHKDLIQNGASAHSAEDRQQNDFYATDPKALEVFLKESGINLQNVWECACGQGHLAEVLKSQNLLGKASDLIDRGYGETGVNFLESKFWQGDILTNPPFSHALEFAEKALSIVPDYQNVILLMRIQFLEGKRRKHFLQTHPPRFLYVSSSRLLLAKNADFVRYNKPSANCYAWYVWQKGWKGDTVVRWFN